MEKIADPHSTSLGRVLEYLYGPQHGIPVGAIRLMPSGELLLVKTRLVPDRHMVRLPRRGWAIDRAALDTAREAGVSRVLLIEEAGRIWSTTLETIERKGRVIDRRFGKQVLLELKYWRTDETTAPAIGQQLSLIAGVA